MPSLLRGTAAEGAAALRRPRAARAPRRRGPAPPPAARRGGPGRGLPRPPPPRDGAPQGGPRRPERGFFAEADPKAEVLPVRRSLQGDSISKKGGRWESDFIWNTDWASQLDYQEGVRRQAAEGAAERAAGAPAGDGRGFLSLAAAKADLNSMDVDLSAQLRPRPKPEGDAAAPRPPRRRRPPPTGAPAPPTRLESRSWARSEKFSTRVVAPAAADAAAEAARAAAADAERAAFAALQAELQAWAAGLAAACFALTLGFYGRDTAASYGVGALGGLLYLRLLNKSVGGLAAPGGGAAAAAGQPRLLIPVILALGLNRYTELGGAERTGVVLSLLPMLAGFFTYKGGVVARQGLALLGDLAGRGGGGERAAAPRAGAPGGDGAAESVDRVFTKR